MNTYAAILTFFGTAALLLLLPGRSRAAGDSAPLIGLAAVPLLHKVPGDQEAFGRRVLQAARRLGVPVDSLMAIMDFESAGTFRPDIFGGSGNHYVGLIQFGEAAANDLGTTRAELAEMTAVQQLDYVEQYFAMWRRRLSISHIDGIADLYLMVLYPAAVRQRDREAPLPIPGQQAGMLYNDGGEITKNSITEMFMQRYDELNLV